MTFRTNDTEALQLTLQLVLEASLVQQPAFHCGLGLGGHYLGTSLQAWAPRNPRSPPRHHMSQARAPWGALSDAEAVGFRIALRFAIWLKIRLRLRLRLGGGGGSVPVATPDYVHSTYIELQLSLATTSYPHPS